MSDQLRAETTGAVTVLTLNKPERRNALGQEMMHELSAALRDCEGDEGVNAIVLTGSPPAFCAGSDLKELGGLSIREMCGHEAYTAAVGREIALMGTPVVAAVEGYALGGGCILALCCDIVVSASNARWSLPEVKNGWLPPWGLKALAARVGPVKARLLTWGVDDVDGNEALRLGLADAVSEPGKALADAIAMASRLAALPHGAVRSTKRFFEQFATVDAERLDAEASRIFADDALSIASQETFSRFAAKS